MRFWHPAVAMAAVVAMPHEKWGETPCAYIELVDGTSTTAKELRDWCKQELAGYKVPGKFVLPPSLKPLPARCNLFCANRFHSLKIAELRWLNHEFGLSHAYGAARDGLSE